MKKWHQFVFYNNRKAEGSKLSQKHEKKARQKCEKLQSDASDIASLSHKLYIYVSVLLLKIKISQLAREVCSHCKKYIRWSQRFSHAPILSSFPLYAPGSPSEDGVFHFNRVFCATINPLALYHHQNSTFAFLFVSHFIVGLSDSTFEFHISTSEFTILHSDFIILHWVSVCDITLGSASAHSSFNMQVLPFHICLIILCMFYFWQLLQVPEQKLRKTNETKDRKQNNSK